ncbi:DapH/DapD/GlmU-related protein [Halalkalicoccus jeotgali]|uniref:UDP-3-O-[3-hydroxymyristoyl] glucosamine N-acyltransferase n=1 Tax=Halalkalicoccus jeotgali (strain DSM 18796 / CECT 7217 / JCM 14584 / KCTC 4019 / B3) TaxID=795797 RepID=D8J5Q7_HALJB|nr:LpxD N-terminal domain-containing protein [Halalkalicoccus jeotgali]ADJ13713.1 UDP-3-O-[3-hydroxymyristoyl] glucosamine N-acyltransferase [Halalkalicoccus jeotgali B3]ELY34240.1 UDP-3-O-[3-hydroxymyristoyl] glucosamine N-acyltransferase [Halalkalicoccus jeotgali B3]
MSLSSTEIAAFVDGEHVGPERTVTGLDALDTAGSDDFAFCIYDDPTYVHESDAGVIVCPPGIDAPESRTLVLAREPKLAFVRIANEFFMNRPDETRIHPTATVADGARVGKRVVIGPHVHVDDCVEIGDDCTLRAGAVLGSEGFGFARDGSDRLHRQIHQGGVVIENDVEIGPNASIDRAVFDETVVERGAKLSGQVHLAHQVRIGRDTTVAYGSGFSGGATVGRRVTVHPHVSVATDVAIGDDAEIGMNAGVLSDVPDGTTVVGTPARPITDQ